MSRRALRLWAGGTAAALAALLLAAPSPSSAVRALASPGSSASPTDPVVALAALVAWGLTGWLALVLASTVAARLPGGAGRAAGAVARRVAPAALRRALEVALGLAVTATALGAGTAAATTTPPAPAAAAASPSLDWPGAAAPDLDWPTAASPGPTSPPVPPPSATPVRAAPMPAEAPGDVVVQPGDSLWRLAERDVERRTGTAPSTAQTAAAWPSWWAANREAVGDDPDLVHPGTRLTPPQDLPTDPSSSDDA